MSFDICVSLLGVSLKVVCEIEIGESGSKALVNPLEPLGNLLET